MSGINWPDWIPKLLEAAIVFFTGLGLFFQNRSTRKKVDETQTKVDENTVKTEETKAAVDNIQVATVNVLDYDRLRRMEAALLTLDECQSCRAKILKLTERRRIYPPVTTRKDAPSE